MRGTDKFYLHLRERRPKTESSSWPFTFFRGTSLTWRGHVYCLAGHCGILWCGSRFQPTNSGVKTTKIKGLRRKILGSFLAFSGVFCPGTKFHSRLGGTRSFLGGTGLEMHSSGTGPVTLFWGTILAWGHTSRLGETPRLVGLQAVIWGGMAPKCPPWRRA